MSETQSSVSAISQKEVSSNNGRESGNSPRQNSEPRLNRRQRRQRQVKRQQISSSRDIPRTIFGRPRRDKNQAVISPETAMKKNPFLFSSGGEARVPRPEFKSRNLSTGQTVAPRFINRRQRAKAVVPGLMDKPQSFWPREWPPQTQKAPRHPLNLDQQLPENTAKGVYNSNVGVKNSKIKSSQEAKVKTHSSSRSISPLLYGTRLLILGVGIGTIAGTLLSVLDPASRLSKGIPTGKAVAAKVETNLRKSQPVNWQSVSLQGSLKLSQEIYSLKPQVQTLVKQNPNLQPGVFLVDLDTGNYLDSEGSSTFSAASMIKLPILVAFFQDVDAGKIRLNEQLTLQPQMIGSGSGDLQYKKPGTKFTAIEIVTKMIAISDNTATNMLIARLGGAAALNQRFTTWGLTHTLINNSLPDLEGTNTSSPKELATLIAMVNQGDFVSMRSRTLILDIMQRTVTNSLLPKGLGKGATIAHKTGDIGSLVGDVGLINMPTGKRYIAAVMVKRPYNDPHAQDLIRQISREVYQFFSSEESGVSAQKLPNKLD